MGYLNMRLPEILDNLDEIKLTRKEFLKAVALSPVLLTGDAPFVKDKSVGSSVITSSETIAPNFLMDINGALQKQVTVRESEFAKANKDNPLAVGVTLRGSIIKVGSGEIKQDQMQYLKDGKQIMVAPMIMPQIEDPSQPNLRVVFNPETGIVKKFDVKEKKTLSFSPLYLSADQTKGLRPWLVTDLLGEFAFSLTGEDNRIQEVVPFVWQELPAGAVEVALSLNPSQQRLSDNPPADGKLYFYNEKVHIISSSDRSFIKLP